MSQYEYAPNRVRSLPFLHGPRANVRVGLGGIAAAQAAGQEWVGAAADSVHWAVSNEYCREFIDVRVGDHVDAIAACVAAHGRCHAQIQDIIRPLVLDMVRFALDGGTFPGVIRKDVPLRRFQSVLRLSRLVGMMQERCGLAEDNIAVRGLRKVIDGMGGKLNAFAQQAMDKHDPKEPCGAILPVLMEDVLHADGAVESNELAVKVVRDSIIVVTFVGSMVTESRINWLLYYLSKNPEVRARIYGMSTSHSAAVELIQQACKESRHLSSSERKGSKIESDRWQLSSMFGSYMRTCEVMADSGAEQLVTELRRRNIDFSFEKRRMEKRAGLLCPYGVITFTRYTGKRAE